MKRVVVLLLSFNMIYAMDKDGNNEYPDQNFNLKPLDTQHAPIKKIGANTEDIKDAVNNAQNKFIGFLNTTETREFFNAAIRCGKKAVESGNALFYNDNGDLDRAMLCYVAAFFGGIFVGRRFSSIGSLRRLGQRNQTIVMEQHQATQEAIAKLSNHIDAKITENSVDANHRVNRLVERLQNRPTAS